MRRSAVIQAQNAEARRGDCIGTGNIGAPVASQLLKPGHSLMIHDCDVTLPRLSLFDPRHPRTTGVRPAAVVGIKHASPRILPVVFRRSFRLCERARC